jgi:4'-phosphopantetheinyl transferase
LLAQYLGCSAIEIRFRYTKAGKPVIETPEPPIDFGFNVAHSDDVALFAFATVSEIGVDVERVKAISHREEIARRFFAPAEYAVLSVLAGEDSAFYRCWTRKEAFLKARGTGIFGGLKDFEVSLAPGEPARLLRVGNSTAEIEEWSLHELTPCDGFIGALAARAPQLTVFLHHYVLTD